MSQPRTHNSWERMSWPVSCLQPGWLIPPSAAHTRFFQTRNHAGHSSALRPSGAALVLRESPHALARLSRPCVSRALPAFWAHTLFTPAELSHSPECVSFMLFPLPGILSSLFTSLFNCTRITTSWMSSWPSFPKQSLMIPSLNPSWLYQLFFLSKIFTLS